MDKGASRAIRPSSLARSNTPNVPFRELPSTPSRRHCPTVCFVRLGRLAAKRPDTAAITTRHPRSRKAPYAPTPIAAPRSKNRQNPDPGTRPGDGLRRRRGQRPKPNLLCCSAGSAASSSTWSAARAHHCCAIRSIVGLTECVVGTIIHLSLGNLDTFGRFHSRIVPLLSVVEK